MLLHPYVQPSSAAAAVKHVVGWSGLGWATNSAGPLRSPQRSEGMVGGGQALHTGGDYKRRQDGLPIKARRWPDIVVDEIRTKATTEMRLSRQGGVVPGCGWEAARRDGAEKHGYTGGDLLQGTARRGKGIAVMAAICCSPALL